MRFSRTKRLRIISSASVLLVLAGLPVALGLGRPAPGVAAEAPGLAVIYASGLSSLGTAGRLALALAAVFGFWLLAGVREQVNRKFLGKNARRRHGAIATLRVLAVIVGAAGLIVGSLSGLYAGIANARPEVFAALPLPFFTGQLALICLLGGAGLYTLGRFGR
jgi:hypothetical protein